MCLVTDYPIHAQRVHSDHHEVFCDRTCGRGLICPLDALQQLDIGIAAQAILVDAVAGDFLGTGMDGGIEGGAIATAEEAGMAVKIDVGGN